MAYKNIPLVETHHSLNLEEKMRKLFFILSFLIIFVLILYPTEQ